MGKRTFFDAAQLPKHQWLIPDVCNAYNELDREEAVNDMCGVHPLGGAMSIALYTVPTIYVHDTRGADPQKYATVTGVIQGCNFGINSFFLKDARPARWGPPMWGPAVRAPGGSALGNGEG